MNINPAHWHLLVNHLPIVGSLFSIFILLLGMFRRSIPIVNLSLVLLVACAVFSMIASQTGESAEHYLKRLNAVDETYLERHVGAANIANYCMMAVGALALITLFFKRIRNSIFMLYLILFTSIIAFALMARAGKLGGEIMHKEIRNEQVQINLQPK